MAKEKTFPAGKATEIVLGGVEGVLVSAKIRPAVKDGLDRVLIQIRHEAPERYRLFSSLATPFGADIRFESVRPKGKRKSN